MVNAVVNAMMVCQCLLTPHALSVMSLLALCWEQHVVVLLVPVAAQSEGGAEGSGALWGRGPPRGGSRDLKEIPRGEPQQQIPSGMWPAHGLVRSVQYACERLK